MFINREDYADMVRPFYETDLIKVITGIRRSGKSVILQAIRDEFLHNGINGDQIIYINLEDFEYEFIKTAADLYEGIIKKDIAGKSSKFEKKTFMDISLYILANAGKEFSSENVINYYKTHHKKSITRQTVYNYLEKMQKVFLVHGVKKYNIVGKEAHKRRFAARGNSVFGRVRRWLCFYNLFTFSIPTDCRCSSTIFLGW